MFLKRAREKYVACLGSSDYPSPSSSICGEGRQKTGRREAWLSRFLKYSSGGEEQGALLVPRGSRAGEEEQGALLVPGES